MPSPPLSASEPPAASAAAHSQSVAPQTPAALVLTASAPGWRRLSRRKGRDRVLRLRLRRALLPSAAAADSAQRLAAGAAEGRRPQRILLYVNPVGGKGRAVRLAERAQRLWRLCGVPVETLVTQRAGEAREAVRTAALRKGDVLVVAGGDGFLAEVVQGLLKREKPAVGAADVPVATLPAGESWVGRMGKASGCMGVGARHLQ